MRVPHQKPHFKHILVLSTKIDGEAFIQYPHKLTIIQDLRDSISLTQRNSTV